MKIKRKKGRMRGDPSTWGAQSKRQFLQVLRWVLDYDGDGNFEDAIRMGISRLVVKGWLEDEAGAYLRGTIKRTFRDGLRGPRAYEMREMYERVGKWLEEAERERMLEKANERGEHDGI